MNPIITAMISSSGGGEVPAPSSNVRIYGMAGQSNMDGRGVVAELPVYLQGVIPKSYYWIDGVGWTPLTATNYSLEGKVGPVGEFAFRMQEKYPNDLHYYVIVAKGSTKLATHWAPGTGLYYNQFNDYWLAAIGNLKNPQVQGFCWMQGEQDAVLQADADAYEANQTAFVAAVKALMNTEKYIDARIHNHFTPETGVPYYETVRTAKDNNFTNNVTDGLINTDAYPIQTDNVHYTTAGYIELGNDFASYY